MPTEDTKPKAKEGESAPAHETGIFPTKAELLLETLPKQAMPPPHADGTDFDATANQVYTLQKEGKDTRIQVQLRGRGCFYVTRVKEVPAELAGDYRKDSKRGGVAVAWADDTEAAFTIACRIAGW